ncbi:S41 family peptidase [Croceitalea sp. MTPC5]|uniref:S41 family peptidase n=1 Tax=Croceitalea sp. MTPC5 TaxID=3056565 RepID=UPI002B3E99C4|nr:S41 family peptidase [Croceitalea sp. MTPC5]
MYYKRLATLLWVFAIVTLTAQEPHFLLDPTLTPDGSTIVFSHDGDLWRIPSNGGVATRLTGMAGDETLARISPDGQWLAFTGTADGNANVYLMKMQGGTIKQLTFHDSADEVDSWSWDSSEIYFTSGRENRFAGYKVSINGGTPQRLFQHYFNNAHNIVVHPKTNEIFFNESWESKFFTNRKRYKGAYNPNIKSYQPDTKAYKEYTSYIGKDMWATIDRNGERYFVSDEANGEYNLYHLSDQKNQLTSFDTSIGRPQVSASGNKVVFTKDYQLFLYDVASKKTEKIAVQLANKSLLDKEQDFKTNGNITNFSISADTKKLAFVSRGELFVSDVKGKFVKHIPTNTTERVQEVLWLKDNKTILFSRTDGGYTNLFTIAADGSQKEKRHTKDLRNNVNIVFDAEQEKAVYISGRDELRLLDLKTFKSEVLVKDEFWALYAPQPYFSPDGSHVLYNAYRNFEQDVFTVRIADKKVTNLTKTGVTETNPIWSSDSKYLYFGSNLTKPSYPYGLRDAHIYQMALDKYENPYTLDEYEKLFKDEPKADDDKKDSKKEEEKKKPSVKINEEGLMERLVRISPAFGLQYSPHTVSKDETTYVIYMSNHDEGKFKLWKTTLKPFEKNKTEVLLDEEINGYQISSAGDSHYILAKGNIHTLDVANNKAEKIDINYTFRRNLSNEFHQMFYEAWAGFEENFYDKDFHGEDWTALKKKYEAFLPYITKRSQLRLLFNDMLGELNTSHFGFRSRGEEENTFYKTVTQGVGIQFSNSAPYTVSHIIKDGPADVSGKNIRVGDKLIAINNEKIDEDTNRESYFIRPSLDKEMQLTFERNGALHTVKIHPIRTYQIRGLLYDEWMDANQNYVDQKSGKKVAYIHMKNMGGNELERFKREMVSEASHREALILDLRYNTGGNVHDEVLQFLSQKPYLNWKYREGKLAPQPNFAPAAKPIVVLINEQSLSDAEMTSAGFKELGLGKLIGTETYRWIVFTSGKGLVDGSFYRLPSWGCYTLDGKNLEKEGVKPDIFVGKNFKDRLEGNHPQLDMAFEEIQKQLNGQ